MGATVGMGLGACYIAGAMARTADTQSRSARLAQAAAHGFSDSALRADTATMEPGAFALARQHDPLGFSLAGLRLAPEGADPLQAPPRPEGLRGSLGPAARPFRFADYGALESTRDLECLTDAVYYESRGETVAGQAAVAQVVLNRVRHPAFPKTVCGVVFQGAAAEGCQFSFACDGSMRRTRDATAWRRAEQIAARALAGFVMPSVGNATHFHVIGLEPGWGPRLLRVAQIGLHVFYRFGGFSGAPATFNGAPQPSKPDSAPAVEVEEASADGHPGGQYILASTTVIAPGQGGAPAATPAPSNPSPKAAESKVEATVAVKTDAGSAKTKGDTGA